MVLIFLEDQWAYPWTRVSERHEYGVSTTTFREQDAVVAVLVEMNTEE